MDNIEEFLIIKRDKIGRYLKKARRLYFEVADENIRDIAEYIFGVLECRLSTATAQETYHGIEVQYHFSHDKTGIYFCPKVLMTDKKHPVMNSIARIVKGAEWIEREMSELWGIEFRDHPKPEPLLTGNHPAGIKQPLRFGRNHE